MKQLLFAAGFILLVTTASSQKVTVKEYLKVFPTYAFSDPDPVPHVELLKKFGKIYPYFRYDGYSGKPVNKEWKVVELENDYIIVFILPEIGGKVWGAIEKSTGKEFIYYNHAVKFRDIAIRGPWTSGGIEFNYGIIGHAPGCSTPVDYILQERPDGSISCVVGGTDLFTTTSWRVDINLPSDKAYFTTKSFWYNPSPTEQPYYTWMNSGIKAGGNLQFIFPGTHWLEHTGGYGNWPVNNQNNREISFYNQNNFGGPKSYHVFGVHSGFFGGYWHDDDFGMGRYATRDDKAGKKIWIWGLSRHGMIWEQLLTDSDGQYVELQSGRLFNQTLPESTLTPFKHKGFLPHTTDLWTEYWFPVVKTKGYVAANNYGVLNLVKENEWLKIYFYPLQEIRDKLTLSSGKQIIFEKMLALRPSVLYSDSVRYSSDRENLRAILGDKKLEYTPPSQNQLSRPVQSPSDFDWDSVFGLYLLGKEKIREMNYILAEEKLRECLGRDPNYLPALTDLSMLLYRRMKYPEALEAVKKALSIDTYDPAANYYYGLINDQLGNTADAKDGFEIASMGMEYRSASWSMLSGLYLKEMNLARSADYARKSIDFNRYAVNALQLLAVNHRLMNNRAEAGKVLDTLLMVDPLSHFSRFEKYIWDPSEENRKNFTGLIRNELPCETYLELALWYYRHERKDEAARLLELAPTNAEIVCWLAFLKNGPLENSKLKPDFVFPFRRETAAILEYLLKNNDHWTLKYHLALIHWNLNNIAEAGEFFNLCGNLPDYPPFYAARAAFYLQTESSSKQKALTDLQYSAKLDPAQWRCGRALASYFLSERKTVDAEAVARNYYHRFPENYYLGLIYAKSLLANFSYNEALKVLSRIEVLPNEGATEGRVLYKEACLMLALEKMKEKNYKKALSLIQSARLWPENLGVGKPYETDIDERLEDWLAYVNYVKIGDKSKAGSLLEKILAFNPQKTLYMNTYSSPNNLVTACALRKAGKKEEAEIYLKEWLEKDPESSLAQWVINAYKGEYPSPQNNVEKDENRRILEKLLLIENQ